MTQFTNAKYFSKIDASSDFSWMMDLYENHFKPHFS